MSGATKSAPAWKVWTMAMNLFDDQGQLMTMDLCGLDSASIAAFRRWLTHSYDRNCKLARVSNARKQDERTRRFLNRARVCQAQLSVLDTYEPIADISVSDRLNKLGAWHFSVKERLATGVGSMSRQAVIADECRLEVIAQLTALLRREHLQTAAGRFDAVITYAVEHVQDDRSWSLVLTMPAAELTAAIADAHTGLEAIAAAEELLRSSPDDE